MDGTPGKVRLDLIFGWAEWSPSDIVTVGDRMVPRVIDVMAPGGSDDLQPSLCMTIEMVDGVPLISKIEIARRDQGRGVQSQDLRAVRLDSWVEDIVTAASSRVVSTDEPAFVTLVNSWAENDLGARKAVRAMRRTGRRKVDTKLLTKVAEVYRLHSEPGKPVRAVELAFGTSYRSAARWVQLARKEGLL